MSVSRADVDTVANELKEFKRKLDDLPIEPADAEHRKFCDLVQKCMNELWEDRDRMVLRTNLPMWSQVVERMQRMQPWLHEACAMSCSSLWYSEKIHEISALVDRICLWQTVAAAEAKAAETVEAEAEWVALQRAARAQTNVDAFASVTVETRTPDGAVVRQKPIKLTEQQRADLRRVVPCILGKMCILETLVVESNTAKFNLIKKVKAYQRSCYGDDTWIWNAEAWEAARKDLNLCQQYWASDSPLIDNACDTCVQCMARYKKICDTAKKNAMSLAARAWRLLGLTAKLEALKDLAASEAGEAGEEEITNT